jgi:hypothetical protein
LTPYREGERGTFQQQVSELQTVGDGTPLLRSPDEAQEPLAPVSEGGSGVLDRPAAEDTGRSGDTTTVPGPSPATDQGPSPDPAQTPATSDVSPSPDPAVSSDPSPSPS